MDLKAVMTAGGDHGGDESEEVTDIAQQQDEETAEALRAFRQSVLHRDANGMETESDDEQQRTTVSGGRKKKTTPRLTAANTTNRDLANAKAALKKRKRSDSAPEKSIKSSSSVTVSAESRRRSAGVAQNEGSSRPLRTLSTDNGHDGKNHKTASVAGTPSSNIPATQAFASPRDFFVAPAGGAVDASHVVCTLCQVLIGSRVFTLKRHLYRHHPQVFRLQTDGNDAMTGSAVATTPRSSSQTVVAREPVVKLKLEASLTPVTPTGSSKKASKRRTSTGADEKMNEAFVAWLESDLIPMKALESALFHQFLSEINPHFKVPEVVVQPSDRALFLAASSDDKDSVVKSELRPRVMKGLCLQGNGKAPMLRTDLAIPVPTRGEALIKIVRAGICGTDLMMIDNYKPGFKGVIGHEFVGIVEQVGSSDDVAQQKWLGKRVVGEINIPCGTDECATCSRAAAKDAQPRQQVKRRNHCPNRSALGIVDKDGVFAEFITLPTANLHVVPDGVVDAHAVFAEPLAAACRILEQQTIHPQARVVILGDGKLGLLVAEVLHAQQQGGANEITLIGKHSEKLALMKHIVAHTLTLDEVTSGDDHDSKDFDVCVECTGTPTGMSLALQLLKRGGTLVMKSTCSAKRSPMDLPLVLAKQVEVVGSRCGPFDMAMALLRDRKVDVQKFIHGVYPLERAEAALAHAAKGGALKIQLVIA